MDSTALNIVIADDHPLFRSALKQALNSQMEATWLEADGAAVLETILSQHDIDLVLLDLEMPDSHGYSTLIHLRSHYPAVPVVVISAHEDTTTISKTLKYDGQGFIPKSAPPAEFAAAIQQVLDGETYIPANLSEQDLTSESDDVGNRLAELTPQQYKVLQMFAEGLLNKQIAYDLEVSEATIKAHATAIFRKLGVRNRTQAVIALQQLEMAKKAL
ncbi:response regulator [Ferrimonas lipolytica]|uniref:Response regulator transcription factor n=1 Tax=Ferrimonas lipolytica TaxID=2724191 RepID=A0A6H1UBG7_9GAMM|nr:response regulator transcription factor [Ferrimonas lipolytica]QIZ76401.1 response regulator transcription factor [Ferrimonas lipolytica]